MSVSINRRDFIGRAARTVAAGSVVGGLHALAGQSSIDTRPGDPFEAKNQAETQPALEWRNRQSTMAYARLGRTQFMVSRCVFGAGGIYSRGGNTRLLEIAIERGMNYIDTGRAYPRSESVLAGVLKRHRDRVWIVSKAGHLGWPDMRIKKGQDKEAAKLYTDQFEQSLRQLRVDTIDCYMIQGVEHEWIVTMDSLYESFDRARRAGKVRFFGLATHTNVPHVCELAARSERYDVVMLAVNPNSLDDLMPSIRLLRKTGIGTVSMKTSGPITQQPRVYDEKYHQMFAGQRLSPYQRAYAYLLHRGGIDAFNSHMPNTHILEENLAVPTLKLSQADLKQIEENARAEARGSCRHCGNCVRACPQGINVASLLRCHAYLHNYHDRNTARALYHTIGDEQARRCDACGRCQDACPESFDLAGMISDTVEALA